jgi:NRPS condensation-like uncharacterized protein
MDTAYRVLPYLLCRLGETRWSASKEEILEEMVAKSTEIDFLKSDKTSLKELTNSEFCKTEEELD